MAELNKDTQEKMSKVQSALASIQQTVNKYPSLPDNISVLLGRTGTTSFDFILLILNQFGVTEQDIIDTVAGWLTSDNEGTGKHGFLDAVEIGIKSVLWANLKNMFTCSINPFLNDNLMHEYYKCVSEGKATYNITQDLLDGDGIEIDFNGIDVYNHMAHNPYDSTSKAKYYFDTQDSPLKGWQSTDFNCFLWYIKNKAVHYYPDSYKNMWDNRDHDFDGYYYNLRSGSSRYQQEVHDAFFQQYTDDGDKKPYIADRKLDVKANKRKGNTKDVTKKEYFYCKYIERGKSVADNSGVLKITLNPKRYYRQRSIKIPKLISTSEYTAFVNTESISNTEFAKRRGKSLNPNTIYFVETDSNGNKTYNVFCSQIVNITNSEDTYTDYYFENHYVKKDANTKVNAIKEEIKSKLQSLYFDSDKKHNKYTGSNLTDEELNKYGITETYYNIVAGLPTLKKKDKSTLWFNKTIFEFNYDYIYSIKLIDQKTFVSDFVSNMIDYLMGSLSSLEMTNEEKLIEAKVSQLIENEFDSEYEDEVDSEDCYYKFSNEEQEALLQKTLAKRENNEETEALLAKIDEYISQLDDEPTPEGQKTIISKILTDISKQYTVISGNNSDVEYNTTFSFNGSNILNDILKQLGIQLCRCVLTPKVMVLYAINIAMMGDPLDKSKPISFDDIEEQMWGVVRGTIKQIKSTLTSYLMSYLMSHLSTLISAYTALKSIEQINYYVKLLKDALSYLKSMKNSLGWGGTDLEDSIDNVGYADIIDTGVAGDGINSKTTC